MLRSLSVVSALLLLTACGSGKPTATPTPVAVPEAPAASTTSGPPSGTTACTLLMEAVDEATLMQPGVADAIVDASRSADQSVAAAGQRLGVAYAAAVASSGTDGEPDAVAGVSAAGADMHTACVEARLTTAG